MVGAGDPQCVVSLHALCTNEDVLKRFVESVPHVELPRDVRGWDDDAEGRTLVLGIGGEIALFRPHGIYSVLKVLRIIDFRKFVILFHFYDIPFVISFFGGKTKKPRILIRTQDARYHPILCRGTPHAERHTLLSGNGGHRR